MKHTALLVDKKVARINRWLERLKQSYSSGAMESALMDAECARADLENLRLDVWANLEPATTKTSNKIFSRFMNFSRVMSLAALIVLLAVFPISKEVQAPALELDKKAITLAEPIIIIREEKIVKDEKIKSESDNNNVNINVNDIRASNVNIKTKKTVKTANVNKKTAPAVPEKLEIKSDAINSTNATKVQEKAVAYDKVFSLMQTGQRALKNNNAIIIRK